MEGITYNPNQHAEAGSDFASASGNPFVTIDYSLYEEYLEGMDLTDQQKHAFLDVLWNIVVNFVDLGFGVHPLQLAIDASTNSACEKDMELARHISQSVVNSKTSQLKPTRLSKLSAPKKAGSINVDSSNKKLMP